MRYISKLKKKRVEERLTFDQISQLYFNYFFLFFNSLIFRGLKLRAFTLLINIKTELKQKSFEEPCFLFLVAMLKITPSVILRLAWLGGRAYEIPFPITYWKKIIYSCKWVIKLLKESNRVVSVEDIANTLTSALIGEGLSFGKKNNTYILAKRNSHLLKNKMFKK